MRGTVGRATLPAWPGLLGVCSMILGLAEVAAGGWMTVGSAFMLREAIGSGAVGEVRLLAVSIVVSVAGLGVGGVAIVMGLGLAWGRRFGARLAGRWGIAQLLVGAGAIGVVLFAWHDSGASANADRWDLVLWIAWLSVLGVWLLGWPLLIILWLGRARIRIETGSWH